MVKIAKRGNPGLILRHRNEVKLREKTRTKEIEFCMRLGELDTPSIKLETVTCKKKGDNLGKEE